MKNILCVFPEGIMCPTVLRYYFTTWSLTHCLSSPLHPRPQQRRAIRSPWHKMSGLSWINFNFRSQHFTFDRWKLDSLTEINLKRSLSLNLNLCGDRTAPRLQQSGHILNKDDTHISEPRAETSGHVWKANVPPNRPWTAKSTVYEQTWQDTIKLVKHENGQSLLAWPLELRIS